MNPKLERIRLRDGRNNWTLPGSSPDRPPFAALAGTQTLRISGGKLSLDDQARKLRFVGTFSQNDDASLPFILNCARAHFAGSEGKLLVRNLALGTADGVTMGKGLLDLGSERIELTLVGQPVRRRLFQVAMPVLVHGSLSRPAVRLLLGRNASKLGLRGKFGVALSPIAALLPLGKEPRVPDPCN